VSALDCRDDQRRAQVRAHALTGLDYLEVGPDHVTLTTYFLGKAPESLTEPASVVIEGGTRVRGIRAVAIDVDREEDPELDDSLTVRVDREGDFSTYTLRLAALDERGRPTDQPPEGVDPRYAALPFSFKIDCPSDADCAAHAPCAPVDRAEPAQEYLAKDYASFRRLILDRLALVAPDWTERNPADIGVTLVELLAYVGDSLSYYQDAVATEAYLGTARRRISVRRHLRLVDYRLHEGCNARAWVCVQTPQDLTFEAGEVRFEAGPEGAAEPFEPVADGAIELIAAHSEIDFWTWGDRDCCLRKGATAATLRDGDPLPPIGAAGEGEDPQRPLAGLTAGDVLVLEEVLGARTGNPADADRTHRQPVALTKVTPGLDELYGQPVVEIEWAAADALPFALCLSSTSPGCEPIDRVAVAHGNAILVAHGQPIGPEPLGDVPEVDLDAGCDCHGRPAEPIVAAGRFVPPPLAQGPVTFSERVGALVSATAALVQDPRAALARVTLTATLPDPDAATADWHAVGDLLASGPADRAFVVEIDDEGHANLRFGDGELGSAPPARASFAARYRIGNGRRGNVGAGAIARLVLLSGSESGVDLVVRNPLAASGGTEPEPVADAKLIGPSAFRAVLQRAITADDYARLAERDPRLQRAAATLQWTGSWYEAHVAVDPLGSEDPDPSLLADVDASLEHYRRIGHDLAVVAASYVPLDLELIVCVQPDALQADVVTAVRAALRALLRADNATFGGHVAVSVIVAAAQAVPGVDNAVVTRLQRLDEPADGELERGYLALGPSEIAQLDDDPSFPEHGHLTLVAEGGR
jgi:baseplate J-like protein